MFPNHYVSTTCGCECSGGLELKNGLAVEPNTPVEILQRVNKLFFNSSLTLFYLTSGCIFPILLFRHFLIANNENLGKNQELLQLVIISLILVTLMNDSGVIL